MTISRFLTPLVRVPVAVAAVLSRLLAVLGLLLAVPLAGRAGRPGRDAGMSTAEYAVGTVVPVSTHIPLSRLLAGSCAEPRRHPIDAQRHTPAHDHPAAAARPASPDTRRHRRHHHHRRDDRQPARHAPTVRRYRHGPSSTARQRTTRASGLR